MSEEINLSALKESDVIYAYSTTFNAVIAYRIEDVEVESDETVQYFAVQRNETDVPDYLCFNERDIDFSVFRTEKACIEAKEMREKLSEIVKNTIMSTVLYDRFGEFQIENFVNNLIKGGVKV